MKRIHFLLPILAAFAATAKAEEYTPLSDYIASVDRTAVSFSGGVRYNGSEDEFIFYDDDGKPFSLTMDAGRKAREEVQELCENSSFMISQDDLCSLVANGTVEIVGSRLQLSVDEVVSVEKR